jgi:hypothetical protein
MTDNTPIISFDLFIRPPSHYKRLLKKIMNRIRRRKFSFFSAVLLSISAHMILFLLICMPWTSFASSGKKINKKDYFAFKQAFAELKADSNTDVDLKKQLLEIDEDKILNVFIESELDDLNMSKEQKVEFYKSLVELLFKAMQSQEPYELGTDISLKDMLKYIRRIRGFELTSGDKVFPSYSFPGEQPLSFQMLSKEKIDIIEELKKYSDLDKKRAVYSPNLVKIISAETGIRFIPTEYYFREPPYEEILAEGANLFFAVKGFPELGDTRFPDAQGDEKKDSPYSEKSDDDLFIFIIDEADLNLAKPLKEIRSIDRILDINDNQREAILDDLMQLTESEQFSYFIENYLDIYHPDQGDLAELTREFIQNNLSSVIIIYDPISTSFTFIEELYFNKPLNKNIPSFWKEKRGTKTGLELLFSLASLYDFEKRGFEHLTQSYKEAKEVLAADEHYKSNVYNKKLKAYIVKEIFEEFVQGLKKRGYHSPDMVIQRYLDEQIKIYNLIIQMGGEEKNRAFYSLGCLYWDEGQYKLALENWHKISDYSFSHTSQKVEEVMSKTDYLRRLIPQINDIFEQESQRVSHRQLDRLLQFHRWEKRKKADTTENYSKLNK